MQNFYGPVDKTIIIIYLLKIQFQQNSNFIFVKNNNKFDKCIFKLV